MLPVAPVPSSGAAHDTHAAAGHVQEHPDTHKHDISQDWTMQLQGLLRNFF